MAESGYSLAGGFWSSGDKKGKQLVSDEKNHENILVTRAASGINDGRVLDLGQQQISVNCADRDGTDGRACDFRNDGSVKKRGDSVDAGTASSCGPDSQKDELWKSVERCISACTKGFVIGSGLRGGLALFTILTRLKRRKSSVSGKSDAEAIRVALKETLRYGLFVGTFAGSFCTVDETIAAIGGGRRTAKWRALVAGAVAGPSLLLTGSEMRHTSMAIYIFMRASVLAARCGIKGKRWGSICWPLTWKHGDTFLMCLSSSQILYAWIMYPKSLPSSYISFLNKHGGKDTSIIHGVKALALKKGLPENLSAVTQHYHSRGVNVDLTSDIKLPCQIIHGGQGCEEHFLSFIKDSYLRSLPVYLPVYLVPALIVHRQGLFARQAKPKIKTNWQGRDGELGYALDVKGDSLTLLDLLNWRLWPLPLLSKTLLGTARSSLFLATYCASAWLWTCWLFRGVGQCNPFLVAAGTFPTGLAVLLEKKSRRMELALYCFSRAIESFGICASDSSLLKQRQLRIPNRVDVVLFSIATSIIMHCYAEERDVFRSKYLNVLDWVFGIPDPKKSATPSKVESGDVAVDEKSIKI
ncbi:unnamed protein product [Calypogeia fissa]